MHRDFFCNKCSLQFGKKYVFDLHLSLVHGEEIKVKSEPQICEDQSKKTPEKVCHDPEVDTSFKCDMCNYFFKTKQKLKRHIEIMHEGKKQFNCNICDANFSTKQSLKGHIVSVHEGKKPYKCQICAANFANKSNMSKHVASIHEGKKPVTSKIFTKNQSNFV